jgi:hypothetical protein
MSLITSNNTKPSKITNLKYIEQLLEANHVIEGLSSADEIIRGVTLMLDMNKFKPNSIDTLKAVYKHGPLFDGDIPSKTGRDILMGMGMITKVIVKGEDGYNACTHKGRDMYKMLLVLEEIRAKLKKSNTNQPGV